MKKYAVTIETEVNFEFFSHVDKDELLKDFCEYIFETDMEGLERFIVGQITTRDGCTFIEGVGRIVPKWCKTSGHEAQSEDFVLEYDIEINGMEVEKL